MALGKVDLGMLANAGLLLEAKLAKMIKHGMGHDGMEKVRNVHGDSLKGTVIFVVAVQIKDSLSSLISRLSKVKLPNSYMKR